MERFLHAGRPSVATVFAPICFPPMPLLAFKCVPGEGPQLAMTGTLLQTRVLQTRVLPSVCMPALGSTDRGRWRLDHIDR